VSSVLYRKDGVKKERKRPLLVLGLFFLNYPLGLSVWGGEEIREGSLLTGSLGRGAACFVGPSAAVAMA
jgi:hypothetical protein